MTLIVDFQYVYPHRLSGEPEGEHLVGPERSWWYVELSQLVKLGFLSSELTVAVFAAPLLKL